MIIYMRKIILEYFDIISERLQCPGLDSYEEYILLASLNLIIKALGKTHIKLVKYEMKELMWVI